MKPATSRLASPWASAPRRDAPRVSLPEAWPEASASTKRTRRERLGVPSSSPMLLLLLLFGRARIFHFSRRCCRFLCDRSTAAAAAPTGHDNSPLRRPAERAGGRRAVGRSASSAPERTVPALARLVGSLESAGSDQRGEACRLYLTILAAVLTAEEAQVVDREVLPTVDRHHTGYNKSYIMLHHFRCRTPKVNKVAKKMHRLYSYSPTVYCTVNGTSFALVLKTIFCQ